MKTIKIIRVVPIEKELLLTTAEAPARLTVRVGRRGRSDTAQADGRSTFVVSFNFKCCFYMNELIVQQANDCLTDI